MQNYSTQKAAWFYASRDEELLCYFNSKNGKKNIRWLNETEITVTACICFLVHGQFW